MTTRIEKAFEDLAEETIRKASDVKCSIPEFKEGLQTLLDAIKERLDMETNRNEEDL